MLAVACLILAIAIVAVVVAVALLGCAGHLAPGTRLALCALAAGLVWAGPGRFQADPGPGLGDLLFLAGVAGVLACVYGRALLRRVDALDGHADGQLDLFRRIRRRDPRPPFSLH